MEPKEFNNLLRQGQSSGFNMEDIEAIIREYPWYATPHLLRARKAATGSEKNFEEQLNRAALYAQDRVHLYHWLREGEAEIRTIEAGVEEEFEKLAQKAERDLALGNEELVIEKDSDTEIKEEKSEDVQDETSPETAESTAIRAEIAESQPGGSSEAEAPEIRDLSPETTPEEFTEEIQGSYPEETEDQLSVIGRLTEEIKSDTDSGLAAEAEDIGAAAVAAAFSLAHEEEKATEKEDSISAHSDEVHSFSSWLHLMQSSHPETVSEQDSVESGNEKAITASQSKTTNAEDEAVTAVTMDTEQGNEAIHEGPIPAPVEWNIVDPIIQKQRERARLKQENDLNAKNPPAKSGKKLDRNSPTAPVSETYANILVQQGMTTQAVAVYEQLSLIYPDKSAYFAGLIHKLKEQGE